MKCNMSGLEIGAESSIVLPTGRVLSDTYLCETWHSKNPNVMRLLIREASLFRPLITGRDAATRKPTNAIREV